MINHGLPDGFSQVAVRRRAGVGDGDCPARREPPALCRRGPLPDVPALPWGEADSRSGPWCAPRAARS